MRGDVLLLGRLWLRLSTGRGARISGVRHAAWRLPLRTGLLVDWFWFFLLGFWVVLGFLTKILKKCRIRKRRLPVFHLHAVEAVLLD
jgi:hypothetical protein